MGRLKKKRGNEDLGGGGHSTTGKGLRWGGFIIDL